MNPRSLSFLILFPYAPYIDPGCLHSSFCSLVAADAGWGWM